MLSSTWENFPHAVVEALAVGTPVIATDGGGVTEVVRDGENGLLVAPGDPEALAARSSGSSADDELRERLRAGARAPRSSVRTASAIYGELEAMLRRDAAE